MKKIVAFALAVIMTMTMFCALTVSSTAADVDLSYKIVCSEPDENGVFNCDFYLVDTSAYGFIDCNFKLEWNAEEVTPVVIKTISGTDVCFDVNSLFKYSSETVNAGITLINTTWTQTTGLGVNKKYYQAVNSTHPEYFQFFLNTTDYPYGWGEGWQAQYYGLAGANAEFSSVTGNELLVGSCQFKFNDGVTSATISADNVKSLAANFTAATDFTDRPGTARAKVVPAAVVVSRAAAVDPVELTVQPGASIRYTAPQGLRFTSSVNIVEAGLTVDDIKLGTYITREDSSKVLDIPAGIFTNEEKTIFTAVIADIGSANYGKTYFAQAYAVVGGNTYTSEKSAGSNPHDVAVAALDDESWQSAYYATQARKILSAYAGL